MANLDLKKLKRKQLLDLLLMQQRRIEELESEMEEKTEKIKLQQRYINEFRYLSLLNKRFEEIADRLEGVERSE